MNRKEWDLAKPKPLPVPLIEVGQVWRGEQGGQWMVVGQNRQQPGYWDVFDSSICQTATMGASWFRDYAKLMAAVTNIVAKPKRRWWTPWRAR